MNELTTISLQKGIVRILLLQAWKKEIRQSNIITVVVNEVYK